MSVELAVIIPALMLLLLLVALGGRLVQARGAVSGAARDAARAASLARYPGPGELGATTLADQAAAADLTGYCTGGDLDVNVTGFPALGAAAPLGGNVTVAVKCGVNTSIFGPLGLDATHWMTGTAVAPLDPYMCRGLQC
ncbi:MAG: TadE/TadG family type IV pilus assembly protein [Trebonia sp.]